MTIRDPIVLIMTKAAVRDIRVVSDDYEPAPDFLETYLIPIPADNETQPHGEPTNR